MRRLPGIALVLAFSLPVSCATLESKPIRIAIAGLEVRDDDHRGEPVASGQAAVDHLHDRLTATGRFAIVERRHRVVPTERLAAADWIVYGTLEATVKGAFDPETSRCDVEVVVHLRVVRVEDGVIFFAKTQRGEAEGPKPVMDMEKLPEFIRLLDKASRIAVDKLADELVKIAK